MMKTNLPGWSARKSNGTYWTMIALSVLMSILAVGGVDIMTVHSFPVLIEKVVGILSDPSMIFLIIVNFFGITYNPATPGLTDAPAAKPVVTTPKAEETKPDAPVEEPAPQPAAPVDESEDAGFEWGPVKGDDHDDA